MENGTCIPIKTQYIYCLYVYTYMIVWIVCIKASLQDFTFNSVIRKLWFFVFVATYVWIKSKVLDTGLWQFYHLFFVVLSIFLGMKSTLAKKINTHFFIYILGYF